MIYFLDCFLQTRIYTMRYPRIVGLYRNFEEAYTEGKRIFDRHIEMLKKVHDDEALSVEEFMYIERAWQQLGDKFWIGEDDRELTRKREWRFRFDGTPLDSRWVLYDPAIRVVVKEMPCAEIPGISPPLARDFKPGDIVRVREEYGPPSWFAVDGICPREPDSAFPDAEGSFLLSGYILDRERILSMNINPCRAEPAAPGGETDDAPPDLRLLSDWIRSDKPLPERLRRAADSGTLYVSEFVRLRDTLL